MWVQESSSGEDMAGLIKKIREIADYPIIIVQDAESGVGDFEIGKHNAIGVAGTEEHAYAFGKCIGVTARNMGYNMLCDPVVDLSKSGSARSLGADKEKVASLSVAMARGLHDAGIMTSHKRFVNIDPDYPATLSKKMIDIIRSMGFDGIVMTDALCMMGIQAKFGHVESKGLAVNAGVDLMLHWLQDNKVEFDAVSESYENGEIDNETLDAAVKRVLAAQKKTMQPPKFTNLTDEDIKMFESINKDCIYAKTDEGVPVSISRDGKHFFAVLVRNGAKLTEGGKMDVDTFSTDWHQPKEIQAKIKELFVNSEVQVIDQFPGPSDCARILSSSVGFDDVVFITFSEALAYTGPEHLTRRIENIITAMQHTDRISTIMHFGNPFVLENLEHTPRYIIGAQSKKSVDAAIDALAGLYPANGIPTYNAKLK